MAKNENVPELGTASKPDKPEQTGKTSAKPVPARKGVTHKGHRQRHRERYIGYGLESYAPHEVLELLLFYSISRRDVNPLAHTLLDKYGTLDGVLNATLESLLEIPGVGMSTALLIRLVSDINRYVIINQSNMKKKRSFKDIKQIIDYVKPYFENLTREVMYMMCLDADNRKLGFEMVAAGDARSAQVDLGYIARIAVLHQSAKVVLAHNHLNGSLMPSSADRATTSMLRQALATLNITLDDHIIVANGEGRSMNSVHPMDIVDI